ncbi:MAG: tetratricopeptide repeat protein [Proteobacteria bacterium]|nr:tetratricopeptide repeat protein [Pseudomonadota bacterium]
MNTSRPQIFQSAAVFIILFAAATSPFFFVGFEFSVTKIAFLSVLATLGACSLALSIEVSPRVGLPSAGLPLLGFLGFAGLSALGAESRSVSGMELMNLAPGLVFFFLTYFSFPGPGFRKLTLSLAVPVAGISLIGILQFFEILPIGMDRYGAKDPASTLGLSNFSAEYLAAVLPLLVASGTAREKILTRIFLAVSFGLGIFYLLLTGNRAGWIGFLAGSALMILIPLAAALSRKRKDSAPSSGFKAVLRFLWLPGLLTGLAVIFLFLTPAGRGIPSRFASIFNFHDPAIRFRVLAYQEALRISRDHPWLGVGPGNFSVIEPLYQTPGMENLYQGKNIDISRVHNEYLGALAELGIPAALLFFLFLGLLMNSLLRSLRSPPNREEFLSRLGILGGVSASLVVALFTFNLHNPASGFIFWVLAGLALKAGEEKTWELPRTGRGKTRAVTRAALGAFFTLLLVYVTFQNLRIARAEVFFRDGLRQMAMEKAAPAEKSPSRAIATYPKRASYYYNRAMCRHFLKNIPEAAADLKSYLELNPYSARGHQALGVMLVELGREPEAIPEVERSVELFPRPAPELYSLLLNLKLGANEYDSVIQAGEKALKLYPHSPEILLATSQARFYQGDLEKAAGGYQEALEADPQNLTARRYLGQAYIEMKKYRSAEELLLPATAQSPGSPDLWYHLARAQAGAGETAAARNSLKTARSLDPRLRDLAAHDPLLSALR